MSAGVLRLEYGQSPPWPYIKANVAADRLGVSRELVEGLAGSGRLRGAWTTGKTGARVILVSTEDVAALVRAGQP